MRKRITQIAIIFLLGVLWLPACLEDLFVPSEEEDTAADFAGVWHRYYLSLDDTRYGLPAIVYLNEDGTGIVDGIDSAAQETPYRETFSWEAQDQEMTITGSNDSLIWSGTYRFQDEKRVVIFTYDSQGTSCEEMYIRYSNARLDSLVGKWILVNKTADGEYYPALETLDLSANGQGNTYLMDVFNKSKSVQADNFDWTTTGEYIICKSDNPDELSEVVRFKIDGAVLEAALYNDAGQTEEYRFLADVGTIDTDIARTWRLTDLKANNQSYPIQDTTIMVLNTDSTGSWTEGDDTDLFNWTTNQDYVFTYMAETPEVAYVQSYQLSENTLIVSAEENWPILGWVTVTYTFTRL